MNWIVRPVDQHQIDPTLGWLCFPNCDLCLWLCSGKCDPENQC